MSEDGYVRLMTPIWALVEARFFAGSATELGQKERAEALTCSKAGFSNVRIK